MTVFVVLLCALVEALQGQTPPPAAPPAVDTQRSSIELQRESIRKQMGGQTSSSSFFSTPWLNSLPPPAAPAVAASRVPDGDCESLPASKLDDLIQQAAKREGVKPDVVRAVIDKESAAYPCAVSPKGAMGLMQLMPATAQTFSVADPFDPKQNIDAGTKFLRQLLDRYNGDLSLALGAYNAGPARVDPIRGLPLIPETLNYVTTILDSLKP